MHTEPASAQTIWDQALSELRLQLTGVSFTQWLAGSRPLAWDARANAWTIAVSSPQAVDWLTHRLGKVVCRAVACHTVGAPEPQIEFVVAVRPPQGLDRPGQEAPIPQVAPAGRSTGRKPPPSTPDAPEVPVPAPGGLREAPPLAFTDFYIRIKVALRQECLRQLKGARLAEWLCLALHMNADAISEPGVKTIMQETGYCRDAVCSALEELCAAGLHLVERLPSRGNRKARYRLRGYAWYGSRAAPALWELEGYTPARERRTQADQEPEFGT